MRDLLLGRPVRDARPRRRGGRAPIRRRPGETARRDGRRRPRRGSAPRRSSSRRRCAWTSRRRGGRATRSRARCPTVSPARVDRGGSGPAGLPDPRHGAGALGAGGGSCDPFGGRADLARGRIRFLHPASPDRRPDARVPGRSLREPPRLSLSPEARRAIAAALAVGAFDAVSGDRLRRELVLILAEPRPRRGRSGRSIAWASTAPSRRSSPVRPPDAPERVRRADRPRRAGRRLALLLSRLDGPGSATGALRRRSPTGWRCPAGSARGQPLGLGATARRAPASRGSQPSRRLCEPCGASRRRRSWPSRRTARGIRAANALATPGGRARARLSIRGSDLVAAGVPPGRAIGRALAATRAALARTAACAPAQELAFAVAHARRAR